MINFNCSILLIFSFFSNFCFSQDDRFINKYELQLEDELMEYVILGDTSRGKLPCLVYCTGSLAHPLFIEMNQRLNSTLPFDYKKTSEDCYIAVLSKKSVPIVAKKNKLNDKYIFIDSLTQKAPKGFSNYNNLEFYVKANYLMIDQLAKYDFIGNNILIVGHSAGARVAAKVSVQNNKVSKLAYLSCEPLGRYYEKLKSCKTKSDIDQALSRWQFICHSRYDTSNQSGDSNITWFSNSENIIDDLLLLNMPIYAAYGTKDKKSDGMILIAYEFYRNNKKNLTFQPYDNLDHSFFLVNDNGTVNYKEYRFDQVMDDILTWWLK